MTQLPDCETIILLPHICVSLLADAAFKQWGIDNHTEHLCYHVQFVRFVKVREVGDASGVALPLSLICVSVSLMSVLNIIKTPQCFTLFISIIYSHQRDD